MRPLRIGLVCPYSLDVPGGVQNHVRDLAAVLAERGHTVAVLAPGDATDGEAPFVTTVGKAVPVRFNGSVARLSFGPRAAARVRRWLADRDFDLLHVHEPESPSVSLLALWASEVPVVATFHSSLPRSRATASSVSLLRPSLEKISARIAVSRAARDTLVQHLGGEPVIIPNGVFCQRFAAAPVREAWSDPGPTIGFLGRTDEPRKGLGVLLAAMPQVAARHPSARLLVAGRGGAQAVTELRRGLRGPVEVLAQVSDDERETLLRSVAVFVAPQTGGESFGIVLVEAMAAGAAVASSDLPAFCELLSHERSGLLFPAGDAAACAEAICRLLDDDGLRLALARAGQEVAARYDWSRLVDDIEAVYATALGMPATARAMRVP